MQDSIISVSNLKKTYKGSKKFPAHEALKGISLDIPRGSIFGLLGQNGAGKSTFINILAGLVKKTNGKVIIDGINQDDDPRKTRFSLGIVPQEVVLDPFFPVAEALEYYAGYFGIPKNERKTDQILKDMNLEDKWNTNSRRLSGGMKRRVLIAKALVHSPAILILDEPTAGVDVELREQLWSHVQKLRDNGTTILLTTHYLEEAEQLCDQIAIINQGKIIANDNKDKLKETISYKELIVKIPNNIQNIPQEMCNLNCKLLDENTFSIQYDKSKTDIGSVLNEIQKAGLTISDISTREPDLEDIFKLLIST